MSLDCDLPGDGLLQRNNKLPRYDDLLWSADLSGNQHVQGIDNVHRWCHLSSESNLWCRRPDVLRFVNLHRIADLRWDSDVSNGHVSGRANMWRTGNLPDTHVSWYHHLPVDYLPRIADMQRQSDLSGLRNMRRHADMRRCSDVPCVWDLPRNTDLLRNDDMQHRRFPDMWRRADLHGVQYVHRYVHLQRLSDLHHHRYLQWHPHMHVGEHMRHVTHLRRHGDLQPVHLPGCCDLPRGDHLCRLHHVRGLPDLRLHRDV